jgi:Protein of unknown function (DUF3712)
MALLNPTPNSFDLNLVSVLGSTSSFHPQLDAFNASVYLLGSSAPFMSIEIPAVKARNGAVTTIKGQHITIADVEGFTKYTAAVLGMETVTILLQGKTGLKEGSLPKTIVNYNKTVTMTGMFLLSSGSFQSAQGTSRCTTIRNHPSNSPNLRNRLQLPPKLCSIFAQNPSHTSI